MNIKTPREMKLLYKNVFNESTFGSYISFKNITFRLQQQYFDYSPGMKLHINFFHITIEPNKNDFDTDFQS